MSEQKGKPNRPKKIPGHSSFFHKGRKIVLATMSAFSLLFWTDFSPIFASSRGIQVMESKVQVMTLKEISFNEGNFAAKIQIPYLEGLKNKELEKSLNEKYRKEGEQLFEEFKKEMEEMKNSGGFLNVDSGFFVKTDTERLLSIGRFTTMTQASSSSTVKYDNIDKIDGVLITLPSLFKNDDYIDVISENIKLQMIEKMKADPNLVYWVETGEGNQGMAKPFEKISPDQNFYISEEGKLVISFDKYEVGPGIMGIQEFEIPTEIIADLLVNDLYIR